MLQNCLISYEVQVVCNNLLARRACCTVLVLFFVFSIAIGNLIICQLLLDHCNLTRVRHFSCLVNMKVSSGINATTDYMMDVTRVKCGLVKPFET